MNRFKQCNIFIYCLFYLIFNSCISAGYVKEPLACKIYRNIEFIGIPGNEKVRFQYYYNILLKDKSFYLNTESIKTEIYVTSLHILPVNEDVNLSLIDIVNISIKQAETTSTYIPALTWNRSLDLKSVNSSDLYIDHHSIQRYNISKELDEYAITLKLDASGIFSENNWLFDLEICFDVTIHYH